MNGLSKKEKRLILILILLSSFGLLFQNCSKGFQSEASLNAEAFFTNGPSEPTSPQPVIPNPVETSKILNCDIPAMNSYDTLSQTCLAKALELMQSVGELDNFIEYEPQFPLWSGDKVTKRRWIYIPPMSQINATDPDNWIFPQGTILFKEFAYDNVIIETRMIEKIGQGIGEGSWRFSVFAKRKVGNDSDRLENNDLSSQTDLLSNYTAGDVSEQYKIGSKEQCTTCHKGGGDVSRGFGYLQLSTNKRVNLDFIIGKGLLKNPPVRFDDIPGSTLHKEAVGYIQANCASCHSGAGGFHILSFKHLSTSATWQDEPLYQTIQAAASRQAPAIPIVTPGDKDKSQIYLKIFDGTMPKIRPVNKDTDAINKIESWIQQL